MQFGGIPPPYLPGPNGKLCIKNQGVTVSHVKSLYQFVVSVEA